MSLLSDFEDRVGGAIEGLFAGAFRSPVQPAEIAKALARAMDDRRQVGVAIVYAPTRFSVQISIDDAEEFGDFTTTLAGELATFLTGHAEERGYKLATRPLIVFSVHEGLKLGRFRVAAEMSSAAAPAHPGEQELEADADINASPVPTSPAPASLPSTGIHVLATVTVSDLHHDIALEGERLVIGRLAECEITLGDVNVSRRHAAFTREGDGWAIEDLGSTNGTRLNGDGVKHARLRDGDLIEVGATQLRFHEPRR
ncbi:MAG: DUF3662 and FHA domain-containing protein [Coriobacteriia bacterium]|nr:DUF3662 and FHA domain-containing protein [Coriobacteriia bacterium]